MPEFKPVEFLHLVHEGEANDEDDFVPLSLFPCTAVQDEGCAYTRTYYTDKAI